MHIKTKKRDASVCKLRTSCFLYVLFVLPETIGELTKTPENVLALQGGKAVLTCSTNEGSLVQWTHKAVDSTAAPTDVYLAGKISRRLESRFSILTSSEGQFDLVIDPTEASDAGTYTCVDRGGLGPDRASTELSVLAAPPTCTSSSPSGALFGTTKCKLRPETVNFTCTFQHSGNIVPKITWSGSGEVLGAEDVTTQLFNGGKVISSLILGPYKVYPDESYTAEMNIYPDNFAWSSPELKILNDVRDSRPEDVCGLETVRCSLSEIKECGYRWISDRNQSVIDGPVLHVNNIEHLTPYRYRCVAECVLRGRRCNVTTNVVTCDLTSTNTHEPGVNTSFYLAVALVLAAICLILIVLLCCPVLLATFKAHWKDIQGWPRGSSQVNNDVCQNLMQDVAVTHSIPMEGPESNGTSVTKQNGVDGVGNVSTVRRRITNREKEESAEKILMPLQSRDVAQRDETPIPSEVVRTAHKNEKDDEIQQMRQVIEQLSKRLDELAHQGSESETRLEPQVTTNAGEPLKQLQTQMNEERKRHAEELALARNSLEEVKKKLMDSETRLRSTSEDLAGTNEMVAQLQKRVKEEVAKHEIELTSEQKEKRELKRRLAEREKELTKFYEQQKVVSTAISYRAPVAPPTDSGVCHPEAKGERWHPSNQQYGVLEKDDATGDVARAIDVPPPKPATGDQVAKAEENDQPILEPTSPDVPESSADEHEDEAGLDEEEEEETPSEKSEDLDAK